MADKIIGYFYNEPLFEICVPDVANVSASDYPAKNFTSDGKESNDNKLKRPFYFSHPKPLRMKVLTWLGKEITWTFEKGKDPIPLQKIFKTPVPLVVDANGDVTATQVTSIQVGY